MRFSTIASAAALAPAMVSAASNADLKENLGVARVHNRCPYPVYLWSVEKDQGCDKGVMKTLNTGESYEEKYRDDFDSIGVSIKISKTEQCKGTLATGENIDITQLEYHINHDNPNFLYNFLDVSFVDCLGGDCPGRDKFYLKSGNNGDPRLATAGADKAICPILSCNSKELCSTMAYVLPDDVQTKSCEPAADTDFYLCTDSPEGGDDSEPVPSSSQAEETPSATPILDLDVEAKVAAAPEVTPAPQEQPKNNAKVKTEVVYVTKYEYVNAKRHAHGHRHREFRA
jgi:hypothetical protein